MAKTKSSFINMVVTLLVVTAVASLALAGVYDVTYEPIQKVKREKRERAIRSVIPDFDTLMSYEVTMEGFENPFIFYSGYQGDVLVGTAIQSSSKKGYSGLIELMVGFMPNGKIYKVDVLQQTETPGLGTKITADKFKSQFNGIDPNKFKLRVKKDGGEVDAITAATISSRAFCDAVQSASDAFDK